MTSYEEIIYLLRAGKELFQKMNNEFTLLVKYTL